MAQTFVVRSPYDARCLRTVMTRLLDEKSNKVGEPMRPCRLSTHQGSLHGLHLDMSAAIGRAVITERRMLPLQWRSWAASVYSSALEVSCLGGSSVHRLRSRPQKRGVLDGITSISACPAKFTLLISLEHFSCLGVWGSLTKRPARLP